MVTSLSPNQVVAILATGLARKACASEATTDPPRTAMKESVGLTRSLIQAPRTKKDPPKVMQTLNPYF